jgi:hypothetical protein
MLNLLLPFIAVILNNGAFDNNYSLFLNHNKLDSQNEFLLDSELDNDIPIIDEFESLKKEDEKKNSFLWN